METLPVSVIRQVVVLMHSGIVGPLADRVDGYNMTTALLTIRNMLASLGSKKSPPKLPTFSESQPLWAAAVSGKQNPQERSAALAEQVDAMFDRWRG